jgi:hypothetical protein
MRRISVLMGVADDAEGQARVKALQQGLQELGAPKQESPYLDFVELIIDKDHVTCRRGIFGEFNHFLRSGRLRVK